jgi:hypothetical protein
MIYLTEYDPDKDHRIYTMFNLGQVCNLARVTDNMEDIANKHRIHLKFWVPVHIMDPYFIVLVRPQDSQRFENIISREYFARVNLSRSF